MTYGLQCFNDSGELTFSSDAYGLTYLGKATYVSTAAAGTSTSDAFRASMTFTFSYAGPITCAIELISGGQGSRIDSVTNSGSTWTIVVWCGAGTSNALGFPDQVTTVGVYVFGLPLSASGYGFVVYDAAGNLSADLLKKPLSARARVSFATNVLTASIPTFTKPAVLIGGSRYRKATTANNSPVTGRFTNRRFDSAWLWDSSGHNLIRQSRLIEYFEDDGGIPNFNLQPDAMTILIEANGLT